MTANLESPDDKAGPRPVPAPREVTPRRSIDPQEPLEDGGVLQEPDAVFLPIRTPEGDTAWVWMRYGGKDQRSLEGRVGAAGGTAAFLLGTTAFIGTSVTIWATVSPIAAITTDVAITILFVLHRLLPDRRHLRTAAPELTGEITQVPPVPEG